MFTVVVALTVRPGKVEEFLTGIRTNARASLREEPGCLRFDVHCSVEDPHNYVLYELYRDAEAFHTGHRQAPHYAAWQQVAARCVVEGGHVNTFATPAFPSDIPENPLPGRPSQELQNP
jgi:autoinducer 2-degrading protein